MSCSFSSLPFPWSRLTIFANSGVQIIRLFGPLRRGLQRPRLARRRTVRHHLVFRLNRPSFRFRFRNPKNSFRIFLLNLSAFASLCSPAERQCRRPKRILKFTPFDTFSFRKFRVASFLLSLPALEVVHNEDGECRLSEEWTVRIFVAILRRCSTESDLRLRLSAITVSDASTLLSDSAWGPLGSRVVMICRARSDSNCRNEDFNSSFDSLWELRSGICTRCDTCSQSAGEELQIIAFLQNPFVLSKYSISITWSLAAATTARS